MCLEGGEFMATTPEGKIKKKVDDLFKKYSIWYYCPQAGPFGKAGIPDRVAVIGGRFLGVECKANKSRKPTKLQELVMKDIEKAGGKCFVVCDDETLGKLRAYILDWMS